MSRLRSPLAVLAVFASLVSSARAQQPDALARGRTLYRSAVYGDALVALAGLKTTEALEYQALCQMALGRQDDAARTIRDLVNQAPSFVPDTNEVPPRFVELFADVRRAALPSIIRQTLTEGRGRLDAKDYAAAASLFERAVGLASDPAVARDADVVGLRFLSQGFADLARTSLRAATHDQPAAAKAPASSAEAATAVVPPTAVRTGGTPPKLIPAEPVRQDFPAWRFAGQFPDESATGVLVVQIGLDGRVTRATIKKGLDPRYDAAVLAATSRWRFRPATLDGTPIVSQEVLGYRVHRP